MKTLDMAHATASLAEYARSVRKEPVVVTVRGKPVAALVPVRNADLETVTLSAHPDFIALIERSRQRQKAQGGMSTAEMRRRLGIARRTRRR
ncbi:MAG: type II toxin-antitoxin system prevent-host-death family antitoxin [Armatimonadetes bacterium]|nr:type II toxin-antitoxin system prevent-host-death family antitoxin [Armatimonadota bacterium]